MRTSFMTKRRRFLLSLCGSLLLIIAANSTVYAKLCPGHDPRGGVLTAEAVVIVKQAVGGVFEVEETFLGGSEIDDIIWLPGLELSTCQTYGPDLVEPITPDTRILLFLVRGNNGWAMTDYGYGYLWVQSLDKVDDLRKKATDALALRKSWEAARDLPDQQERVRALWPYLWKNDYQFFNETRAELQKNAPVAGDFAASQFAALNEDQRDFLIRDIGLLGGERLHQVMLAFLNNRQKEYETLVKKPRPQGVSSKKYEREAGEKAMDIDGDLYYGVEGLASFRHADDMAYIRQLGVWAAKRQMDQTCKGVLDVFGDNPDKLNLPVINTIFGQFGGFTEELDANSYFFSLRGLEIPDAIPLFVKILGDNVMRDSAHARLIDIVGTDLGRDASAWLKWYAEHH